MLVQGTQTLKSLHVSWISQNLTKLATAVVCIATVASLYVIINTGPTASLLCFQSQTQTLEKLPYPKIDWDSVPSLPDRSSPYASFRFERWIVISVSTLPTLHLSKINGWQLLALETSNTPHNWSLKGAIFLSLDQQSKLGFRVTPHLPYHSHTRKTIGYLFAIQHGAKQIYDADQRSIVLNGSLSKHFDIQLLSSQILLQYSHENPNRTVVNPYIHFGQRSVWPRGLPLETVADIKREEFYTEVFGGKQFIQQGISNGLPDVDSVFYFTRKSSLDAFDIRFDDDAPKVALPHGVMVPLNSFNTVFHSPAFWGLMLPVSVSRMASDVLRGYWAQRILWEIDGNVAIYPPTVHRYDRVGSYPFSEEKDLHVNVLRLIKFLVEWRSESHGLFDKILELSYSMAEEGFWGGKDVEFTAAWLQDLLAVSYNQPRLMSIDFGRPRPNIGEGDRKEFVPKKFPSVHLGVEEAGAVSYEIGNLIRWRKNFGNIVLVMFCGRNVERTALEWRLLYGRIFKTVIILSHKRDVGLAIEEAELDHIYKFLPAIFNRYASAEGFLFLQDDTVLNYWNLVRADKNKLWSTDKVFKSWMNVTTNGGSDWFSKQADTVNKVVSMMPVHFQVAYRESVKRDGSLVICSSEVFYVPRRFISDFIDLVNLVGDLDIHHKAAVPMFFVSMDSPKNFDTVLNSMVYEENHSSNSSAHYSTQVPAVHPWNVSNQQDFIGLIRVMAGGDPLLMELF